VAVFFLLRHGAHDLLDRILVGRMDGVPLNAEGVTQARLAAEYLAGQHISEIRSSPRQRALETAEPIAMSLDLPIIIAPDIDEIDLGDWTGRPFSELRQDPLWQKWNRARSETTPPGGETIQQLQHRCIAFIRDVAREHPDGRIVLVSHAEPLRMMLLEALHLSIDDWWRVKIAPGDIRAITCNGEVLAAADNHFCA
jgi:broad specificity phosphatase PhoE